MDQGIPISTHDLLAWIGGVSLYLVFMVGAVIQWRRPDLVSFKSFPAHEEPGERFTPKHRRRARRASVVVAAGVNVMAGMWLWQQLR